MTSHRLMLLALAAIATGCAPDQEAPPFPGHAPKAIAEPSATGPEATAKGAAEEFPVPPPPLSEGIFPCSNCHDSMEPNLERRELGMHEDKQPLRHGDRERWCFDCHNPKPRDVLRLASGTLVPFSESYRLCGQCHGDKYRDWKVGVHGKRTGSWNGKKQYLLCVSCHDPHAPHFKPLKPLPPPMRPADIHE